ncbi:MAG: DUF1566 domain-containing protein [bacterium]
MAVSEQIFVEKGQMDNTASAMLLNRMQCSSAKASKHICIYWSSTEYNANNAWNFNFNNGNANNNNKSNNYSVRAVRAFSTKLLRRRWQIARQLPA